ncbi:MAG: hypothetical protein AAF074_07100 [Pseudomonadota bacterium]
MPGATATAPMRATEGEAIPLFQSDFSFVMRTLQILYSELDTLPSLGQLGAMRGFCVQIRALGGNEYDAAIGLLLSRPARPSAALAARADKAVTLAGSAALGTTAKQALTFAEAQRREGG